MLRTEPSFSIYSTDDKENEELIREKMEESATVGESVETQFSFGSNSMRTIEEGEEGETERALDQFKDLGESGPSNSDHDGDPDHYFSKLAQENPSNPLVLKNYAQYLQSKRDFSGAEEYYYRATLAGPKDGEILSEYAKLAWEVHGDRAKASDYFERAAQAAPGNSDVLAAYASFMWRIGDESDEEESWSRNNNTTQASENSSMTDFKEEERPSTPHLHLAMGPRIDGHDGDYQRMVEENPRDLLSLKNYAVFLHQSKGDLVGAEEYYSRAILEDPNDGEMLSLYASVSWQLHGDRDKAITYFERAVVASPEDSNVLGAYAKFLWETEAEEEDEA